MGVVVCCSASLIQVAMSGMVVEEVLGVEGGLDSPTGTWRGGGLGSASMAWVSSRGLFWGLTGV